MAKGKQKYVPEHADYKSAFCYSPESGERRAFRQGEVWAAFALGTQADLEVLEIDPLAKAAFFEACE